jgi:hypothetical protein
MMKRGNSLVGHQHWLRRGGGGQMTYENEWKNLNPPSICPFVKDDVADPKSLQPLVQLRVPSRPRQLLTLMI